MYTILTTYLLYRGIGELLYNIRAATNPRAPSSMVSRCSVFPTRASLLG